MSTTMAAETGVLPVVRVTRRYRFSASHRLHSPLLSDEMNREIYGKCNNPYGHGHNYTLDVTVAGRLDARRGRLLPLNELDDLVRRVVLQPMDRRDLNSEVAEFASLAPTTENLAQVIVRRLEGAWESALAGHPAMLEKVRIWETRNNIFEVSASQRPPLPDHAVFAAGATGKE